MTRANKAIPGSPLRVAGPAAPDRRLSSIFTKRTLTAPVTASSIAVVTTFAPTLCGVANFSRSLSEALITDRGDTTIRIVRLSQGEEPSRDPQVVYDLAADERAENQAAARVLNKHDVVLIQHEFGIYGGDDGDQVVEILEWINVPVVVVLHTVPANPTPGQRAILDRLTSSADGVVAMSETARRRLIADYQVSARKIMLIPHGAFMVTPPPHLAHPAPGRRPVVLTWGLLGPGKGIEWGIEAMLHMRGLDPLPRYVVAGHTHPKVLAAQGESYRQSLVQRADQLGVSDMLEFEADYLSPPRLLSLLQRADVVLLPYDSSEQVTSGVLVEAVAANVPVVSTSFPHAAELLAGEGGGLLVPHQDPQAIAQALTRILIEPGLAEEMVARNARLAPPLSWSLVASQYRQLFDALLRRPVAPVR
jgi:glycosyltransferase involved in cell wall biosynthesis